MQTHRAAVHFPSRAVVGRHMAAQGDITRRVSGAQRAGMLQCALRAHLSPRSPRPSTRHSVGRGSPCGTRRLNLNARKARERPLCRSAPRASEAALRLRRRSSAAAPQRHWSRCGRSSVGAGRQQMMTLLREQCRICSGAVSHLLGSRCTSAREQMHICSEQLLHLLGPVAQLLRPLLRAEAGGRPTLLASSCVRAGTRGHSATWGAPATWWLGPSYEQMACSERERGHVTRSRSLARHRCSCVWSEGGPPTR